VEIAAPVAVQTSQRASSAVATSHLDWTLPSRPKSSRVSASSNTTSRLRGPTEQGLFDGIEHRQPAELALGRAAASSWIPCVDFRCASVGRFG